jgi:hypothetical protein
VFDVTIMNGIEDSVSSILFTDMPVRDAFQVSHRLWGHVPISKIPLVLNPDRSVRVLFTHHTANPFFYGLEL